MAVAAHAARREHIYIYQWHAYRHEEASAHLNNIANILRQHEDQPFSSTRNATVVAPYRLLFDPFGKNRTLYGPGISSPWHRKLPFALIFSLPAGICFDGGPYSAPAKPPCKHYTNKVEYPRSAAFALYRTRFGSSTLPIWALVVDPLVRIPSIASPPTHVLLLSPT